MPAGLKLVGAQNFVRNNPFSDRFEMQRYHHIEFWTSDATSTYKRFSWGLGMPLVAKSDQSTGNSSFASYVLQSNDLVFTITAPYSRKAPAGSSNPIPWFDSQVANDFVSSHGLAVRAVGIVVADAKQAYEASVANGGIGVLPPTTLRDEATGTEQVVSEVTAYGDVVLRYVSGSYQGPFLAGFETVSDHPQPSYGLQRLDHAVGNAWEMEKTVNYLANMTGFHEFAEFTAEDVGTLDSGLNSMVLANNNELVIMPINEPTYGTPRKSQILTYLEQNEGPGLQHLALKTDDIFNTLRQIRARSSQGGFDFMPPASKEYYAGLREKIGDALTPEQYKEVEELSILVDKDDQGVLLQIFTRPLSDRPTIFLEIIQRVGCMLPAKGPKGEPLQDASGTPVLVQAGGCGGFGKGNFSELFKRIEEYERTLEV